MRYFLEESQSIPRRHDLAILLFTPLLWPSNNSLTWYWHTTVHLSILVVLLNTCTYTTLTACCLQYFVVSTFYALYLSVLLTLHVTNHQPVISCFCCSIFFPLICNNRYISMVQLKCFILYSNSLNNSLRICFK